ncbi:MAG: choice-of-anchor tandem repeat GloVer-containing protein [Candidatus Cybelea sp.]
MRSFSLGSYALSGGVAVALLAGCGGSPPPIGAPGAMPQSRTSSGYDTLYSFGKRSSDGQQPKAGLIDVSGTLYGTTYAGGSMACSGGCGTVFRVKPSGKERVVYRFTGGTDGANPSASLLPVKGVLYGTTEYGGLTADPSNGTVFSVSSTGSEKVLHRFYGFYYHGKTYSDGANPVASLIDVNGELYGTTSSGGDGQYYGTVFRISTSGREKVLHSFGSPYDGADPAASLLDMNGTLYGITVYGGQFSYVGDGTVFSVSTTGTEKVIYVFYPEPSSPNGAYPLANLINVKGTFYGTTADSGVDGGGTAFNITSGGQLTVLHSFGSATDGSGPAAAMLDEHGTLYGTTSGGGAYGKGTVFSMSLTGAENVLHSFGYGSDGATPLAGLIDVKGTLYGTTSAGGTYGHGTVFALRLGSK